jgi:hypothetical protein
MQFQGIIQQQHLFVDNLSYLIDYIFSASEDASFSVENG